MKRIILHCAVFFYILRCTGLKTKCNNKIDAKCNKVLTFYMLVDWSETVKYDLEMLFSITYNFPRRRQNRSMKASHFWGVSMKIDIQPRMSLTLMQLIFM